MAFLSGKLPRNDDGDELEDETEIDEQPTQPLPTRVCPVCLYHQEMQGAHVAVGTSQLRLCADHMDALCSEPDWEIRLVLREQMRRAFNWYFWPTGYRSFGKHAGLGFLDDRGGDRYDSE